MALRDYINPQAENLSGFVNFTGLIRDLGRGVALAIVAGLVGGVVAVQEAFFGLIDFARGTGEAIFLELFEIPLSTFTTAPSAAALPQFEFLAGPTAVVVVLSTFLVVAFFAYYVWRLT